MLNVHLALVTPKLVHDSTDTQDLLLTPGSQATFI